MNPFLGVILTVIDIYTVLVIAAVIVNLLKSFNVLNNTNQAVYQISQFLDKITEPVLKPIRKVIPLIAGFDITPIILLIILEFLKNVIVYYFMKF